MDVDDFTQEVFVSLLRTGSDFKYATRKYQYVLLDAAKVERNRPRVREIESYSPPVVRDKSESTFTEILDRLTLPPKIRCICECRLRGFSFLETGTHCGCSASYVYYALADWRAGIERVLLRD